MNKKLLIIPVALGLLALTTAGSCDSTKSDATFSCKQAVSDAADGAPIQNCSDPTHLHVFRMPNGFRNVVFGCNGHVGMYVTSRGWSQDGYGDVPSLPSGITAVPNDPNCP